MHNLPSSDPRSCPAHPSDTITAGMALSRRPLLTRARAPLLSLCSQRRGRGRRRRRAAPPRSLLGATGLGHAHAHAQHVSIAAHTSAPAVGRSAQPSWQAALKRGTFDRMAIDSSASTDPSSKNAWRRASASTCRRCLRARAWERGEYGHAYQQRRFLSK